MYKISRACYDALNGSSRKFTARAVITLADGSVMQLGASDIKQGGIKLDEATSKSGSFELGAAIMSKLTLTLNNSRGNFSDVNFIGGQVSMVQVGAYLGDSTIEWIPLGVFDIDSMKISGTAAELTAYDMLGRADRNLPESIAYPVTLENLLRTICTECGIPYNDADFINAEYTVDSPPEKSTCREVIAYIAQLAGSFAKMTRDGYLELTWYGYSSETMLDGGNFIDMTSGDTADGGNFYVYYAEEYDGGSLDGRGIYIIRNTKSASGEKPLTITGVRYIEEDREETSIDSEGNEIVTDVAGAEYLVGTDEYIFDLSDNPLIQHDIEAVLAAVGEKLIGDSFSPLSVTCTSNPALEAGDIVRVTDRKGNVYTAYINAYSYKFGGAQTLSCDAESEAENQSVHYNASAKLESKIKSTVNVKINDYNRRVQTLNNLMLNSMGVYKSTVQNSDGSTTYYTHDKPTLEESSYISCETSNGFAYTNNGWNEGNPVWQYGSTKDGNIICNVLAAVGIVADWIKAGRIESNDGSCYFDLDNNQLFANKIGLPTRYLKAGEVSTDGDTRAGIACCDEEISDNPYFQIRTLKSTDGGFAGYAFCDINGNPQIVNLAGNGGATAVYAYDEDNARKEILAISAANKGVRLSSLNGSSYITVTDDGIKIYKDGTLVQSW